MSWYTVSLLLKSIHSPPSEFEPLWEERLVLVEAQTEEQAHQKGEKIGKEAEQEYGVDYKGSKVGEKAKWTFMQVASVCQIESESLLDGTELFSRFLRDSEVKSLLTPFDDE